MSLSPSNPEDKQEHGYTTNAGDFTITFPDITPPDISREMLRSKIVKLFNEVSDGRYVPNKVSKHLRSGVEQITSPSDLTAALIPGSKYLAENVLPDVKEHIATLSEKTFSEPRQKPLKLHIYPGSFNLPQALAGTSNTPTMFDHLFLRQVIDIIQPIKNSEKLVKPIVIDDTITDRWIFSEIIADDFLRKAQSEHTTELNMLTPPQLERVEEIFPAIELELERTLQALEEMLKQSSDLSGEYLSARNIISWSQEYRSKKLPPPVGTGFFDETQLKFVEMSQQIFHNSPLKFLNLPTTWEFYQFALKLSYPLPPSPNIEVYNVGEKLPENQVKIAKRMLARELTYNTMYAQHSELLPRIVPGNPAYYKKFMHRFAIGLKPSGYDFGIIPQFVLPTIIVPSTIEKAKISSYKNPSARPDLNILVQIDQKKYNVPVNTGGRSLSG